MDFNYQFEKYSALLERQDFDPAMIDYSKLDVHISFLKQLAIVENSSLGVFDIYKKRYVFMRSKFLQLLGVELDDVMTKGPRVLYSLLHPDDIAFVIETHYRCTDFLIELPDSQKKEFKSIYTFRMRDDEGTWHHFIQQLIPLELDLKGNLWLMLMVNDLLPGKDPVFKQQRKMVNINTGKLYLFNDESESPSETLLTKREIEILGLLAKGMASKHVADKLFLSVNTVNNHRRNILEKTKTENTAEAIRYAISLGIL